MAEKPLAQMNTYELMFCLGSIVQWWEDFSPEEQKAFAGMATPEPIMKARILCAHYAKINAQKAGKVPCAAN